MMLICSGLNFVEIMQIIFLKKNFSDEKKTVELWEGEGRGPGCRATNQPTSLPTSLTSSLPATYHTLPYSEIRYHTVPQGCRKQVPKVPALPESFHFDGKFCFEV